MKRKVINYLQPRKTQRILSKPGGRYENRGSSGTNDNPFMKSQRYNQTPKRMMNRILPVSSKLDINLLFTGRNRYNYNSKQIVRRNNRPSSIDGELNVFEYLHGLWCNWWLILLSAVLLAILAYWLTSFMPTTYEAYVHLALINPDEPGAMSATNRRFPEVSAMLESGFLFGGAYDSYRDVMIAKMKSRQFSAMFMEEENLLPHLFPDHWDTKRQTWTDKVNAPTLAEAFLLFNKQIRTVNLNVETGMMALRMSWTDPKLVAEWANKYVKRFNSYQKELALGEINGRIAYLKNQLKVTEKIDMEKAIYRLIEAQMEMAMLISAREEFVFNLVDPATIPIQPSGPNKKGNTILGFLAGAMLGVTLVIGRILLRKVIFAVNQYLYRRG